MKELINISNREREENKCVFVENQKQLGGEKISKHDNSGVSNILERFSKAGPRGRGRE